MKIITIKLSSTKLNIVRQYKYLYIYMTLVAEDACLVFSCSVNNEDDYSR